MFQFDFLSNFLTGDFQPWSQTQGANGGDGWASESWGTGGWDNNGNWDTNGTSSRNQARTNNSNTDSNQCCSCDQDKNAQEDNNANWGGYGEASSRPARNVGGKGVGRTRNRRAPEGIFDIYTKNL